MKDYNSPEEQRSDIPIPHKGSLCKLVLQSTDNNQKMTSSSKSVAIYSISLKDSQQLHFSTQDYQFLHKIFKCLDRNSMGYIHKRDLENFCDVRCPLDSTTSSNNARIHDNQQHSMTIFDTIWNLVLELQQQQQQQQQNHHDHPTNHSPSTKDSMSNIFGLEAFMIFAKFISLVQYQDARRKFSSAHATKKDKTQTEEEQMIMIDLPPFEPEKPLSMESLFDYEAELLHDQQYPQYRDTQIIGNNSHDMIGNGILIPLPELDLDHSFIFIHDDLSHRHGKWEKMSVQVSLFSPTSEPSSDIEFILRTRLNSDLSDSDDIIVKRSFADIEWLHQNLKSHQQLGGTLCGRILPPFPSKVVTTNTCMDYEIDSTSNSSLPLSFGSSAIANSLPAKKSVIEAASKTGKGIFNLASKTAKSLLWKTPLSTGDTTENKTHEHSSFHAKQTKTTAVNADGTSQHSSIRPLKKSFVPLSQDILVLKAKQLERYLNYLLENPALSSSFPLRMILMASQSGLEATKELLDELKKKTESGLTATKEIDSISSTKSEPGNNNEIYQSLAFKRSLVKYLMRYSSSSKDIGWLRTAAQAALVLNFDSLLETAGYQSTSTKLQHASLPKLASSRNIDSHRMDQDIMHPRENDLSNPGIDYVYKNDSEFDGFDLLPNPLPLSERSALCAKKSSKVTTASSIGSVYSDMQNSQKPTILGEIDIERDVRSLYELLKKVDTCLEKCCAAIYKIAEARRSCSMSQMSILQSIDSWQGMRGQIIMQRFLLSATTSLKSSNDHKDESFGAFSQDMVWNASLAGSSKLASKAVTGAVDAARVAKKAKQTAEGAVHQALSELSTDIYKTPDEIEKQKEDVVRLRMQSLHAAVVEHETAVAKRNAAVSLANDVMHWNSHRKRSLLDACVSMVRSQLSANEEDLKAWCQLRDGILSSPNNLFVQEKIILRNHESNTSSRDSHDDDSARYDEIETDSEFLKDEEHHLVDKEDHIHIDDYFAASPSNDDESENDSISNAFEKEHPECEFDEKCQDDIVSFNPSAHNILDPKDQEEHLDEWVGSTSTDKDKSRNSNSDGMSESMQSLVEGLLSWGGNWDADEEINTSQVRLPSLAVNSTLFD